MNAAPGPSPEVIASAPRAGPKIRRVAAVVNTLSRGVGPGDADALAQVLSSFDLEFDLACPGPEALETAIQAALDASPDLLIVFAGDGTAREAARLCGPDGPLLAILPGGTMNVLSHALYGVSPWRETVQNILAEGVERTLSGGEIAGRPFYVAAVLGSPALWAPVREAARAMHWRTAWRRARYALSRAFAGHLRFQSDVQTACRTTGLGLICPLISRAFDDDQPALEAALLDQRTITEVIRLGVFSLTGDWRRDPSVATTPCRRGRVWARRRIPAILDGETFILGRSVDIEFKPRAYRALVPPPA